MRLGNLCRSLGIHLNIRYGRIVTKKPLCIR